VDTTPATRSFTVDTTAPDTSIDSGPAGATNDSTPTFSFSADQPGSSFECRVDGGAWAACSSAHTTATLGDGSHTFEVRATDPAGNSDPTPASRTFTVATAVSNPPGDDPDGPGDPGPSDPGPSDPGPSDPGPSDPGPTTPDPSDDGSIVTPSGSDAGSDLGGLAGSLVGERSCQRLGAGLRTKRMKVRGIGNVTVRIQAPAIVMADEPLGVAVTGPQAGKGRLRSVSYSLDGRRQRGGPRQPFALAIKPAALQRIGRHALTLQLKPKRGPARTVKLGMRTFPCVTVFRAYQRRTPGGSQLKLRIDARHAVAGASFSVPASMLPKARANLTVGSLRVVSAGSASRSWKLSFGAGAASGTLLGGAGTPSVTVRGGSVSVGALPADTGIVEIFIGTQRSTRPSALVKRGGSVTLRAALTGASAQRLSYKLRGR
jgi:hypothetical protein